MAWVARNEAEQKAIDNLHSDSDRGAAVTAGSLLEYQLEHGLLHLFRNDDPKILSGSMRYIDSFDFKIRLGFLLRFYGKKAFTELMTIKDIRNSFAHAREYMTFENDKIRELCHSLTLFETGRVSIEAFHELSKLGFIGISGSNSPRFPEKNPRTRFLDSCAFFMDVIGPFAWPIYGDDERPPLPRR